METIRLVLAQINFTVGALPDNAKKIIEAIHRAQEERAQLIVFPELAISGYPPEDLLLKSSFIKRCQNTLDSLLPHTKNITVVVGFPEECDGSLYNAAAILYNEKQVGIIRKQYLPNYGVFDEKRYFKASTQNRVCEVNGSRLGISICEDIWEEKGPHVHQAFEEHAELLINISASPYHHGKGAEREVLLRKRAISTKKWIAYCNLIGGQDELVFDGRGLVVDPDGNVFARAKSFQEDFLIIDIPLEMSSKKLIGRIEETPQRDEEVYQALTLGTRDYIRKNNFSKVVIGLSGGIDSSLVACVAVDALGADNVVGVSLPSRYSSSHSQTDAQVLAQNLNIQFLTIPIESLHSAYLDVLTPVLQQKELGLTEENLQARIRGTLLMALSNYYGWLILTTGNKSEMAVGYSTLYGDMAGGFAVIKDVSKTLVYELCHYRNRLGGVIPENVLLKPPSAELRPEQKDSDSLPPYSVLDPILEAYVERNAGLTDLLSAGFPRETVLRVMRLVDKAEYKRRQAPPGIKITPRALGKDWRLPLTNHYHES